MLKLLVVTTLFFISAVRHWNSLPKDIVLLDSLGLFKSSLVYLILPFLFETLSTSFSAIGSCIVLFAVQHDIVHNI